MTIPIELVSESTFKRRDILSSFGFNFALCSFIGLVISAIYGKFWQNQVISHSIGWSAFVICESIVRHRWPDKKMPTSGIVFLAIIGPLFGVLVGGSIAMLLLGYPISTLVKMGWLSEWPTFLITLIATVCAIAFGIMRGRKLTKEIATAKLAASAERSQRELADAELNVIRTQVEPHMMFNTLANLRALIGIDQAAAIKMLDHFNDYLRASLGSSRATTISLDDEFKLLENYLEIMKIRMGERMTFDLALPHNCAKLRVAPWLLQPLIENAIKHGLEPSIEGGHIAVSAQMKVENTLKITVENTGEPLREGFSIDTLKPTSAGGLGLYQSKNRIERMFGQQAHFRIARGANNRGTRIEIELPIDALQAVTTNSVSTSLDRH
jgi:sensor histidine kinase YesM